MDTPGEFPALFHKGDNFCDFLFALLHTQSPSEMGSTLKGKNLLLFLDRVDPSSKKDKKT